MKRNSTYLNFLYPCACSQFFRTCCLFSCFLIPLVCFSQSKSDSATTDRTIILHGGAELISNNFSKEEITVLSENKKLKLPNSSAKKSETVAKKAIPSEKNKAKIRSIKYGQPKNRNHLIASDAPSRSTVVSLSFTDSAASTTQVKESHAVIHISSLETPNFSGFHFRKLSKISGSYSSSLQAIFFLRPPPENWL